MSFNYFRYGSYIGSNTSVGQMKGRHDLRSHQLVRPFAEAISVTNKDTHTVTLMGGTYKIFLMGAGGGGSYTYTNNFGGNGGLLQGGSVVGLVRLRGLRTDAHARCRKGRRAVR